MKIFHIPPRFLDSQTLIYQRKVLEELFEQVYKFHVLGEYEETNFLLELYKEKHAYIFARLEMVCLELRRRKIDGEFEEEDFLNKLQDSNLDTEIEVLDITSELEILYQIWEEYGSVTSISNELSSFIEQLSLVVYDDVISEIYSEIERIKEEYELN